MQAFQIIAPIVQLLKLSENFKDYCITIKQAFQ